MKKKKKPTVFNATNSLHFNLLPLMLVWIYYYRHFAVFLHKLTQPWDEAVLYLQLTDDGTD